MKRHTITKLRISGPTHPEPDGADVSVEQTSRNEATLTCLACGKTAVVAMPGGRVDRAGLAALEDGVQRMHRKDA